MKRTVVLILGIALSLNACMPALPFLPQGEEAAPAVDVQATDEALAATLAVETLNALPTPSSEVDTSTPDPTQTDSEALTPGETTTTDPNATTTETITPDPNASATTTGTVPTGTGTAGTPTGTVSATSTVTATGTLSTFTASPTETLYARFFGTLPPALPSGNIKLVNKAKVEVYVSLQCTTIDGYNSILEYPVRGRMKVSAPAGKYTYVAWVGGAQFSGGFNLDKNGDVSLTFKKDKVIVQD